MIELVDIVVNSLWILGLSVILAVWSYARYTAQIAGVRIRDKFQVLKYALVLNFGLLLFLTGMAFTEKRLIVRIIWIILGIAVLVESGMRIKQKQMESE